MTDLSDIATVDEYLACVKNAHEMGLKIGRCEVNHEFILSCLDDTGEVFPIFSGKTIESLGAVIGVLEMIAGEKIIARNGLVLQIKEG